MPIPVDYFQPLSFQQANPFLAGLQTGQDIYKTGMQNAYLPQSLQQQLQGDQLRNALMQNQANFAPQMSQAQLGLLQAQAKAQQAKANMPGGGQFLPGPAGQVQGLEYLRTNYGENSTQYQEALKAYNQNLAFQNAHAQYYAANVGLKNLTTPVKNAVIGQGMPLGIPGTPITTPGNVPQQNVPAGSAPQQNASAPNVPNQNPSGISTTTPSVQNNLNTPLTQKAAQIAANQGATSNSQKVRLQAGQALEDFLNTSDSQNTLNTIANYSGLEGAAKAQIQRFTNPKAYLQYKSAVDQFPTIIAGGLKLLEGYPSTDLAIQNVKNYFKEAQSLVKTDPAAAHAYIQQGLQYIRDENAAVRNINQPIFKMGNIYGEQNNASANKSDPLGIR